MTQHDTDTTHSCISTRHLLVACARLFYPCYSLFERNAINIFVYHAPNPLQRLRQPFEFHTRGGTYELSSPWAFFVWSRQMLRQFTAGAFSIETVACGRRPAAANSLACDSLSPVMEMENFKHLHSKSLPTKKKNTHAETASLPSSSASASQSADDRCSSIAATSTPRTAPPLQKPSGRSCPSP